MRKIIYAFGLLALLFFAARPVYALGSGGWRPSGLKDGRVIIGQDFTLKSGEVLDGDLVVIGGAATVEDGARVNGDVVVIGGSLKLDGQATGSTVVIGGVASIGEKASVGGDMVTVGGSLQRAAGATIVGDVITNLAPPSMQLPKAPNAPTSPASLVPPKFEVDFGWPGKVAWIFILALLLAILAMCLTLFIHPQLDRVAQAIVNQPVANGGIGLLSILVSVLAVGVLGLLSLTLILIPVTAPLALVVLILLVLAWLFGAVALGMEVGDRLMKAFHAAWAPVLSAGLGTFMLSIAVGTVNLVPCVGLLAVVIIGLIGLGAAVITQFGTRSVDGPALSALAPAPSGENPLPPVS